ncbi:Fc.00g097590.m01.CDS01 [Cosmosporella sp. VM-42]
MKDTKVEPQAPAVPAKEPLAEQTPADVTHETKPDGKENDKPATEAVKDKQPVAQTAETSTPPKIPTPKGRTPSQSLEIDKVQPLDFEGELATNNEIPSPQALQKIENYVVLDRHGKTHTFKSLYTGSNVARRVLIIFVRHFFCGNCQEFLRSLSESITPDALLQLPVSTFIAVVGCGDPSLIDMYVSETNCPFPVYTDPKRSLFDALGMTKTLSMGAKPAYMKKAMSRSIIESVIQGLKQLPAGRALKSGDQRQVGGEFLFEPLDLATPVTTPQDEIRRPIGAFEERAEGTREGEIHGEEEKRVTWCHRMKTTRDHAEIPELMEVLGLSGNGQPIEDKARWSKALEQRKGTGLSMASEMSKLSAEQSRSPTS